jgi:hypothetical protein
MPANLRIPTSLSNVRPPFWFGRALQCQPDMFVFADRRLAQQTTLLKERNQSLLKAVGSVRSNPSSSTVVVGGEECVCYSFIRMPYRINALCFRIAILFVQRIRHRWNHKCLR